MQVHQCCTLAIITMRVKKISHLNYTQELCMYIYIIPEYNLSMNRADNCTHCVPITRPPLMG